MPFHDRIYSVYAILGAVDALPRSTSTWARISEALMLQVECARGLAATAADTAIYSASDSIGEISLWRLKHGKQR